MALKKFNNVILVFFQFSIKTDTNALDTNSSISSYQNMYIKITNLKNHAVLAQFLDKIAVKL